MEKSTYIIWKSVYDRNVRDVRDVVGLFHGTYEEADVLLAKLNTADPSVQRGVFGQLCYNYYRTEPSFITPATEYMYLEFDK